jgi:hypothetical protein
VSSREKSEKGNKQNIFDFMDEEDIVCIFEKIMGFRENIWQGLRFKRKNSSILWEKKKKRC